MRPGWELQPSVGKEQKEENKQMLDVEGPPEIMKAAVTDITVNWEVGTRGQATGVLIREVKGYVPEYHLDLGMGVKAGVQTLLRKSSILQSK